MQEYPKILYKKGTSFEWEGLSLDLLTVNDADEEKAATGYVTVEKLLKPEKPKK